MPGPTLTNVTVSINSGSSIVTRDLVLRALGLTLGTATIGTDADGNVNSVAGNILLTSVNQVNQALANVPGVSGVAYNPPLFGTLGNLPQSDILDRLNQWALTTDNLIQFAEGIDGINGPIPPNTYAGPFAGVSVAAYVTNGLGVQALMNDMSTVVLSVTGGTAASPRINGVVSPVTLVASKGRFAANISASGAGTVLLSLSSPTHPLVSLTSADTATVTLS